MTTPEYEGYTGYTILYTGSFSPVTNAHVMAVKKMIEYRRSKDSKQQLRVVIVPASDKYVKTSLNRGNPEYLSEEVRYAFLDEAFQSVRDEYIIEVIISRIEYEHGTKQNVNPSTDTTCKLLKSAGIISHNKNMTFYVMGADNIERGLIGWNNPKALMDEVTIVVVTRGDPVLEDELMNDKNPKNMITPYYNKHDQTKILWSQVRTEQNARYVADRADKTYDIWTEIQQLPRVKFTISEFSSSLLRNLILNQNVDKAKDEEVQTIIAAIKFFNSENGTFATISGNISEQRQYINENLPDVISKLTPISLEKLSNGYDESAKSAKSAKSAESAGGMKKRNTRKMRNTRNTRKKTRRGNRSIRKHKYV
jgi:nicotinic acid mononucleotide adenylyltransferase